MRKWLLGPLHLVRFLTVSDSDLCKEVFSQNILNSSEISQICTGVINKNESLCDDTEVRGPTFKDVVVEVKQPISISSSHYITRSSSSSCIVVKNKTILLKSLTCKGNTKKHGDYMFNYREFLFGETTLFDISVTVQLITNHFKISSDEKSVVVSHNNFSCGILEPFTFPTIVNGRGLLLKANSKYRIDLKFSGPDSSGMPCWDEPNCVDGHDFEHGTFHCSLIYPGGIGNTPCHIREFTYSVAAQ